MTAQKQCLRKCRFNIEKCLFKLLKRHLSVKTALLFVKTILCLSYGVLEMTLLSVYIKSQQKKNQKDA
jgi:hypothetical protein